MSEDLLAPLTGPAIRIRNRDDLEQFLVRPDAAELVRASSFEQVFFTIKSLDLVDCMGLLALVEPVQVRGFIDLDCWRKDTFVRRPFMEWMAAFIQCGPETTVRALRGIDEDAVALFLKDLIEVFEIERDEPPPDMELTFTPDGRLAVRVTGDEGPASIASMILDALFRYDPDLGLRILRRVRYTTRIELEETAYENKTRRLDVHGFVDYYEALSIYAEPERSEVFPVPGSASEVEIIPGELVPQPLPTVFAEAMAGGDFLVEALGGADPADTERLADELTALGNRILSANLVNMGEVAGVRVALEEMRDFLTIGLERLANGDPVAARATLAGNHVQAVFRTGFAEVTGLNNSAQRLIRLEGFKPELLESPDVEFVSGLVRFKPLLWTGAEYRSFRTLEEVRQAARRVDGLVTLVRDFMEIFGEIRPTLRQTFNTAVIRKAISGRFVPDAIGAGELEVFLADGVALPPVALPAALSEIAIGWLATLEAELRPLVGRKIDPRFVDVVHMRI